MPELPDVEGFRRILAEHATGRRIQAVTVEDPGVLRDTNPPALDGATRGRMFAHPDRRGKWLMAPLRTPGQRHRSRDPTVIFHFGMTGGLVWTGRIHDEPRHRDDRVVFCFAEGELRYRDLRKLHGIRLVQADDALAPLLSRLGPDAWTVTAEDFDQALAGLRRQLKPALMDQAVLAGLGNLLVDEILWRARLQPRRSTSDLTGADRHRLYRQMRNVLRQSIDRGRVPGYARWLTGWRDDEDAPCPRCGTPLRRSRVGGRTTVWCPHCQPE
ncbi:DNA-formamidopyrimidine glycosylase family protein [Actinopolymorpha sp. B9G3]|uniref:Fpg/Nei family DNA glycosylase n=1 Tax=Actinopolymorpha sp. B9G3 TaxID=3158970 RepID=UPI0032D9094B